MKGLLLMLVVLSLAGCTQAKLTKQEECVKKGGYMECAGYVHVDYERDYACIGTCAQ